MSGPPSTDHSCDPESTRTHLRTTASCARSKTDSGSRTTSRTPRGLKRSQASGAKGERWTPERSSSGGAHQLAVRERAASPACALGVVHELVEVRAQRGGAHAGGREHAARATVIEAHP